MIRLRAVIAVGLAAALALVRPAWAQAMAEGFSAEGVWMYQPKDGETVELTVVADKPLRLFFKGYLVVTEVQRSAELDLLFASNMVEIRAQNRKRGQATMAVKGGDGRMIKVFVQVVDGKKVSPSPEIVTIR